MLLVRLCSSLYIMCYIYSSIYILYIILSVYYIILYFCYNIILSVFIRIIYYICRLLHVDVYLYLRARICLRRNCDARATSRTTRPSIILQLVIAARSRGLRTCNVARRARTRLHDSITVKFWSSSGHVTVRTETCSLLPRTTSPQLRSFVPPKFTSTTVRFRILSFFDESSMNDVDFQLRISSWIFI